MRAWVVARLFYNVFFAYSSNINVELQVKVEYVTGKWITFMVSSRLVSDAEYRFKDLI